MKTRDIFYRTNKARNEISESGLRLILAFVDLEILSPKVWTWGGSSAPRGANSDKKSWWLEPTSRALFTGIRIKNIKALKTPQP